MPIPSNNQESEPNLRERDVRNLRELLSTVDTFAIDEFFVRARDSVISDEALYYYVAFRAHETASAFQIYDGALKSAIKAFSEAWDVCIAYGDYFFPSTTGTAYQFQSSHDTDDPDDVLQARQRFFTDLLNAESLYAKLVDHIKAYYPEVDFKETNRRARESYASELNLVADLPKQETYDEETVKPEVAENRRSPKRFNFALWARRAAAIISLIAVLLVLFFGNNVYQQITGRSFFQDAMNFLSSEPIVSPRIPVPTSTVAVTPGRNGGAAQDISSTPPPSRELPAVYESFDVCIDRRKWDRIPFQTPRPPLVTDGCILLDNRDSLASGFVDDGELVFSALEPWEDGLTLVQYASNCKVREVYLDVLDLQINGKGWIGLTVDHPQKAPEVISLWLGRFAEDEVPLEARSTNTHSPLSQNERAIVLVEEMPSSGPFRVGVRFEDANADSIIEYDNQSAHFSEIAAGYANNFSIVYSVGESSEFSARIDEVRVRWEPEDCGPSNLPPP